MLLTSFAICTSCYAALTGSIYHFQRRLMYHPIRGIAKPGAYGLRQMRDVQVTSPDGLKLELWVQEAKPCFPTIIYFHGNAASIAERAPKLSAMVEAGFGVVALSYRGFGNSEGLPSENGIYDDARAAILFARTKLGISAQQLVYFGESLGSGVAVQMALEEAPGLLVLEAAYTSVETRSAELYPYVLGVRSLVLDKFDSLAKIKSVHAPLLMLHGRDDAIIPLSHGKTLFETANQPKSMIVYPGIHHADFTTQQIVEPIVEAAGSYGLIKAPAKGGGSAAPA